jgi:photosystem II stability/assembly factor-like uncharacterized protein
MVAGVSADTLWRYISELSGHEPVIINGRLDTLVTRYSYSWRLDRAADYLSERLVNYGLDVTFHHYVIGTDNFYACDFVDMNTGWVVGGDQKIYKTRDGGQTWRKQVAGLPPVTFWGVCFIDTLRGWVSGSSGKIFHTSDGGRTWVQQASPTRATLREICFFDSLNGWIVGHSGKTLRTIDGGQTWASIASGVTGDLYGLHFVSPDRGWAVGRYGVILHWDGYSWSGQASGTGEYLLDVHFGDRKTGWAVGSGSTVLKTSDGGDNWIPQAVPDDANPYFRSVCFADTAVGWVVGLNGTVLESSDGGRRWNIQHTGTLFGLCWVRFLDTLEGWAVGYGSTILYTGNGGTTWENRRDHLPVEDLIGLKSVVATKPGTVSGEQVVICGHFDSTSEDPINLAPGADDNASGTAAVIEAARILGKSPFEKTIKFICFSGEEQGLYGSGEYAGDASAAGEMIGAVINFDMIGYADTVPEDINLVGNAASEWLVDFAADCAGAYVPGLAVVRDIDAGMILSDHASFWKAGYSAILGIEDSDIAYPYYHTTGDTLGHLTKSFVADVARMGIAAVAELAVPDTTGSSDGGLRKTVMISAHPNPFRNNTVVVVVLASGADVDVGIYDVEGRMVENLFAGSLPAGANRMLWQADYASGGTVAPGIYFARVRIPGAETATKLVFLR